MADPRFEKLREFLLKQRNHKATTKQILALGQWTNADEFREWRRSFVQGGVLILGRGRGGSVTLGKTDSMPTGGAAQAEQVSGLSEPAKKMLELIPQDGTSVGNVRLRSKLGLTVDEYWKIRKELLDSGLIEKGKGRGGSVSRTGKGLDTYLPLNRRGLVKEEKQLYPPMLEWVKEELGKGAEDSGDYHYAAITAYLWGKEKKGKWSRPDVTYVQVTDYPYLPNPVVEVTSFEVKPHDFAKDLASVYEAGAHTRMANYSYLVAESASKDDPVDTSIEKECERLGVGLLRMFRAGKDYEFVEELQPRLQNPDPEELNSYLEKVFSVDEIEKKKFQKWISK